MAYKTILAAFGGVSPEHEVSVITAIQAVSALRETGLDVVPLYVSKSGKWYTGSDFLNLENYQNLPALLRKGIPCTFSFEESGKTILLETGAKGLFSKPRTWAFDVVLAAFHGSEGENGAFQGLCESFNVPYTGSGVLGSSIGMDKYNAKALCRTYKLPVVDDVCFYESEWVKNQPQLTDRMKTLGYPLFVKPVSLGSSIGVAMVTNESELIEKIETAFRYDNRLIVEKGVDPLIEINCSVLGTPQEAIPSTLEQPMGSSKMLSFQDKYQGGGKGMASADRQIPALIEKNLYIEIQRLAVEIFKVLNCSGLARLDFLVNADSGEVYFNEINTIPGSFSFYLWQHDGLSFDKLLIRLFDIAVERHREKNGRVRSYETNLLSEKAVTGLKGLKGPKNR